MIFSDFKDKARTMTNSFCVKLLRSVAFAALCAAIPVQALELQAIGFHSEPGGTLQIKMDFDGVPPEPAAYNIERPARISLDLAGVTSGLEKKKYTLSYGNTQSVVVLETTDRTRVVINLLELSPYLTAVEGNSLLVDIGTSSKAGPFVAAEDALGVSGDEAGSSDQKSIAHIDFQRGEAGEGNVIVELSDDRTDIDVRVEGREIRVDFIDANVTESLQRSYDVLDFATPVKNFKVAQEGANASISILPSGDYDYLAYQTDNIYVLSVRPLTDAELDEKNRAFAFVGEKLSLNFQDIKVRSVLQLIADFTELNLVTSDTVSGNITLRLQDVPWDQALELILKTKGLDSRQIGNVLMVAPAAEIAERELQEIETQKQLQELAPLQTEFIRVRYANARELFKLFEDDEDDDEEEGAGSTGSILSPRGRVVVDERTNTLLITDTAEKIEEFKWLIANIDVPLRQVMVEARIVVATDDVGQELGVTWGGGFAEAGAGDRYAISGSTAAFTSDVDAEPGDEDSLYSWVNGTGSLLFDELKVVDLGASNKFGKPSTFALGFLTDDSFLSAELSAIAAEGRGEVVSQPKVITGDKQQAEIKTGEEIPYLESSANGRTTVKFREAVLSLNVTPSITPDNRLILDLVIKQDSRSDDVVAGENSSSVPIILKNEIETQVLVDNGKTIVLGGIFRESEIEQETKVPLLGDIPVLGHLFKRSSSDHQKSELLIFITPRILTDRVLD
jgi:type IV pilus assembly protein PilQ